MSNIEEIQYKDTLLLYTDLSNLSAEEAIKVLEETLVKVPTYGEKKVYSLLNVKGINFNTALMKMFNKVGRQNQPYVAAIAVCGLTSMTLLLAKGVIKASGRKADFFTNIEDGKEWLNTVATGRK